MARQEHVSLRISGISCEDCTLHIEAALKEQTGIFSAKVDFNSRLAEVIYPTLSEAIRICAQGFFKDATKLSCCAE